MKGDSHGARTITIVSLSRRIAALRLGHLVHSAVTIERLRRVVPVFSVRFSFNIPTVPFEVVLRTRGFGGRLMRCRIVHEALVSGEGSRILALRSMGAKGTALSRLATRLAIRRVTRLYIKAREEGNSKGMVNSTSSYIPNTTKSAASDLLRAQGIPGLVRTSKPTKLHLRAPYATVPVTAALTRS